MDFPKVNINFLLNTGGLGDNIAALPALKYIEDSYPWVTPFLYVPDYFLPIVKNMMPDMIVRSFSKAEKKFNGRWPARQTKLIGHDSLATHLVDYNFHCLANKQVDISFKNYLKLDISRINVTKFQEDLYNDYIVIACGYTAPIRKFPGHTINKIVEFIKSQGLTVVFMGSHQASTGGYVNNILSDFDENIDYTQGVDLLDKTTLLEAGKIIAEAKAIIGIDCGLMHIAGCTDTNIIGGYTSVEPRLRLPIRNNEFGYRCYIVEPPDNQPEKYCQSRLDFVYDHDFRHSFSKTDDLVNSLTADMFIEQIKKVL